MNFRTEVQLTHRFPYRLPLTGGLAYVCSGSGLQEKNFNSCTGCQSTDQAAGNNPGVVYNNKGLFRDFLREIFDKTVSNASVA